jgi:hypothetical protein
MKNLSHQSLPSFDRRPRRITAESGFDSNDVSDLARRMAAASHSIWRSCDDHNEYSFVVSKSYMSEREKSCMHDR